MSKRRGVALIAALMLLSLLALVTAGGFAASVAVRRAGRVAKAQAAVATDADGAIGAVVSNWSRLALSQIPVGQTDTQEVAGVNTASPDTVLVTHLPSGVYWVVATASTALPERARRRVNLLLRTPPLQPGPSAAITSVGSVGLGPGVTLDQDTTRQLGGVGVGVPCGQSSANVVLAPDTAAYELLPQGWASFAGRASVRFEAGAHVQLVAGPILYGGGDLVVDGGSGQGLLLVEGHLTVDGQTVFKGLIVARGGITISAPTEITGAIMSAAPGNGGVLLQNAAIHYSACTVAAAVAAASVPRAVRGRSWVEMF